MTAVRVSTGSTAVRVAAALAVAGFVHSLVNARLLRRPPVAAPVTGVAVLVPARDEQDVIAACVASAAPHRVVVLDDGSTDDTAARAGAAGADVLAGTPPPAGWLGKPWACAQLTEATTDDVLVFVDADVRLAPGAVDRAVAMLRARGLDVVCPFPRQEAGTPAERLVQPLLQWSWLTTLPLRAAERSRRTSLAAGCGQFLVIRRTALERAGGFAAVRGAVLEDIALVRAVKTAGGRGGVVDGSRLAATRMYGGWAQLRDGYGKSLWAAFGSPAGAAAVVGGLAFVYVLPPLAALCGSRAGQIGYAAGVASRVVAARVSGGRAWPDALVHPASVVAFGVLTARSVREHRRGTLRWKGRAVT